MPASSSRSPACCWLATARRPWRPTSTPEGAEALPQHALRDQDRDRHARRASPSTAASCPASAREVADVLRRQAAARRTPIRARTRITVEDFLTMSSLLECNDENQYSRGNEERMYLVEDWAAVHAGPAHPRLPGLGRQARRLAVRPQLQLLHRRRTATLGAVCSSGRRARPLDAFAERYLFGPLGITGVEWQFARRSARSMTGGGLGLRSRDLLKLGQLYLDGGRVGRPAGGAAGVGRGARECAARQRPRGHRLRLSVVAAEPSTPAVATTSASGCTARAAIRSTYSRAKNWLPS